MAFSHFFTKPRITLRSASLQTYSRQKRSQRLCLILLSSGIALSLGGCAYQKARTARAQAPELIGMSEHALRACAGKPSRTEKSAQGLWMTFYSESGGHQDIPGAAALEDSRNFSRSPSKPRQYCKLEALIDHKGIVKDVRLLGSGGIGGRGFGCDDLLFRCR